MAGNYANDNWMDEMFAVPVGAGSKTPLPTMVSFKKVECDLPAMRMPKKEVFEFNFDDFKINLVPIRTLDVPVIPRAAPKTVPWAGGDYFGYCYMTEHLSKPEGFLAFRSLLEAHWAQENLAFWKKVEDLHHAPPTELSTLASDIFNEHCKLGCPSPVNVSSAAIEAVRRSQRDGLEQHSFDDLQIEISKSMQLNYWSLYVHSPYQIKYLETKFKRWKIHVPKDKKKKPRRRLAVYDSDRPDSDLHDFSFSSSDDEFSGSTSTVSVRSAGQKSSYSSQSRSERSFL